MGDSAGERDGAHVVTASDDQTARVAACGRRAGARARGAHGLRVLGGGERGRRARGDGVVRPDGAVALADGELVRELKGHTGPVMSAAVSADGVHVVTASDDETARVWRLADGELVRELKGHTSSVNSAAVSADGVHVVTASCRRDGARVAAGSGIKGEDGIRPQYPTIGIRGAHGCS